VDNTSGTQKKRLVLNVECVKNTMNIHGRKHGYCYIMYFEESIFQSISTLYTFCLQGLIPTKEQLRTKPWKKDKLQK
jgi:hypothetical protein